MHASGKDTVAVFGQGPVGLSGTLSAKAMGARVIAMEVVPERRQLAKELGADHVINPLETDPVEAIKELTGGMGASVMLETSGNPAARQQMLAAMRPFGRACYVGAGAPAEIDFNRDVIFKVATIYGSWTFSKAELIEICRFMVDTKAPLEQLITHHYDLGPGGGSLSDLRRRDDREVRLLHGLTATPPSRLEGSRIHRPSEPPRA